LVQEPTAVSCTAAHSSLNIEALPVFGVQVLDAVGSFLCLGDLTANTELFFWFGETKSSTEIAKAGVMAGRRRTTCKKHNCGRDSPTTQSKLDAESRRFQIHRTQTGACVARVRALRSEARCSSGMACGWH
jgi:hypothetical protein